MPVAVCRETSRRCWVRCLASRRLAHRSGSSTLWLSSQESVPRVPAFQQARAVLDGMRTDLAKLVRTMAYQQAVDALRVSRRAWSGLLGFEALDVAVGAAELHAHQLHRLAA